MEYKLPEDLCILHIDMDAFYASVEERDNQSLKGKPVIVGGSSNHGIVTTANYEARKYGVHSAMPIFMAKQMCPKGIFVPTRIKRYRDVSEEVFSILNRFTNVLEQVSIDEAYLDISNISGEKIETCFQMKREVFENTGLTLSMGLSFNKFLAKLASDWNKPNGMKIIMPSMVPEILLPLPIEKIHGIGKKTTKKLNDIGIYKVQDLIELSEEFLIELLGKHGTEIYYRIRGIDNRNLETERERKSLGTETTLEIATREKNILKEYLYEFSLEIEAELKIKRIQGRTITLKIKDEVFKSKTRSRTLDYNINSANDIYTLSSMLLDELNLDKKIRLIGISISNFSNSDKIQLSLFNF
ncbi:DNA polymerase IV [Tissierella creatinophila]|uniref:DNA polymerase IV n=1 Tax=Tissierella creatinophila DSM 6911 TaxID=1123403 RepID=A0A1U7M8M0_TISCR|nr:DNA polymerase IV [Tissierella creatinophila]OLS03684.1 DNA polymerase IV [Tissierella creatinophila DSM 6911]